MVRYSAEDSGVWGENRGCRGKIAMSRLRWGLVAGVALGLSCLGASAGVVEAHDPPPEGARPGECFGQVILPAVYGQGSEQVLERPAWSETVRGEAVTQKIVRKVLVRPERVERVRAAPVYKTQVSWVTSPGRARTVRKPDRYEVVKEKVLVEAGHAEWRPASSPIAYGESRGQTTVLEATGEVMCRVWVPARYAYKSREVLVERGRTYTVRGPAVRRKVVKKVLVSSGGWVERRRPAVYRNEVVRTVVREGAARVVSHPATYSTVSKSVLVRAAGPGWAKVVCGGQLNPAWVALLQQRLVAQGFDAGPSNGVLGPQTMAALKLYQRTHNQAQGQVTVETARSLGLI
jgi:hypothetical protein